MGGAYNTTKGNDKIYAAKIENEIKLNVKTKKLTLKINSINWNVIMQPTCPTLTMHLQNNVKYTFAQLITSPTTTPKCHAHYMPVN